MVKANPRKLFIVLLILLSIVIIAKPAYKYISNQFESRQAKIVRLNKVAKSLPDVISSKISATRDQDGECKELTDSSALPALVYKQDTTKGEATLAKDQFISDTIKEGIIWTGSNDSQSALFERNNKTYKIVIHAADTQLYASLTACN